jgi:teichuronic acid biosynthesis glycosyltransferase TuaC
MFITTSNLFPCPGHPTRGMYNHYLFRELRGRLGGEGNDFENLCLVPSWKVWEWASIRCWTAPTPVAGASVPTRYIPVPYLPWVGRSLNDRLYSWALRRFLNCQSAIFNHQSSIFYVPWLYPDGVAVARVVRERHARLWLMALGTDTFQLASAVRRRKILAACEQAEGVICVAGVLADRLAAVGVPRSKLHVVPNGVDTSLFRMRTRGEFPADAGGELLSCQVVELLSEGANAHSSLSIATQQLNNSTTHQLILFTGNLVPVKGPDILLKAFVQLVSGQRSDTTPHLVLIGDGPMRQDLEQLALALGITDQVHFLGRLVPEQVALWMNRADVLCLSSHSEGMPNVVLEARAAGLPVVATPAGMIPEIPLDKAHFLVVPSCTPEAIAAGLTEMLSRDRINRKSDPAIPTWAQQADKVLALIGDR